LGPGCFANDLQELNALRLQQNQVASGFGFEFVKHGAIVRLAIVHAVPSVQARPRPQGKTLAA
jgi:hypothetical protein